MVKILAVGDPHGEMSKIKKVPSKNIDFVLCTGDVGKADFARKFFFENLKRKQEGLEELEYDEKISKKIYEEIFSSSIEVWRGLSKIAPTYSILGNVGMNMIYNSEVEKDEKKYGIKLPYMRKEMNKIKDFYFVRNVTRRVEGLRIGFLEYFIDTNWVQDFKPKDYSLKLKKAKKETDKAKRILKNFGKVDILVCHQPPYGYLDKVSLKYNPPKDWVGKNAGSKTILNYIKKFQPKYVFCGHIHEGEGMAKIGKTEVYNLGVANHKVVEL